jgi:uncharacterized protein (TIGR02118 family)
MGQGVRVIAMVRTGIAVDAAGRGAAQAALVAADPLAAAARAGWTHYVRGLTLDVGRPGFGPGDVIALLSLWTIDADAAIALAARLNEEELFGEDHALNGAKVEAIPVSEGFFIGPARDLMSDGLRATFFVHRRKDMSIADFRRHWAEIHGPMLTGQAGVSRYRQNSRLDASYAPGARFDGVAELSFADMAAFDAFSTCEPHRSNQMADLPNLFDLGSGKRFFTRETAIF